MTFHLHICGHTEALVESGVLRVAVVEAQCKRLVHLDSFKTLYHSRNAVIFRHEWNGYRTGPVDFNFPFVQCWSRSRLASSTSRLIATLRSTVLQQLSICILQCSLDRFLVTQYTHSNIFVASIDPANPIPIL